MNLLGLLKKKPKYVKVTDLESVVRYDRARVNLFRKRRGEYTPVAKQHERIEHSHYSMLRTYYDRYELYKGGK